MIVVLDTNVILSALLSATGKPAQVIQRWEAEDFKIATSPVLLSELKRALGYTKIYHHLNLTQAALDRFIQSFSQFATVVLAEETLAISSEDPPDNRVLECALKANASIIVSGDEHLLKLGEYRAIAILPPAGFLALLDLG